MTVNIIKYVDILLYTFDTQTVNHLSPYARLRLPLLQEQVMSTFCYMYIITYVPLMLCYDNVCKKRFKTFYKDENLWEKVKWQVNGFNIRGNNIMNSLMKQKRIYKDLKQKI